MLFIWYNETVVMHGNKDSLMDTLTRKAYAKINLSLDVTGKRGDGYHDLKSVMQTVDVYDTLTFHKTDDGAISLTANTPQLATDDSNLIVKACRLMRDTCGIKEGIEVDLLKEIPMQAGLGGGSADAACALRAVNDLFSLNLSTETLCGLGAQLGADVPFLVRGGTCLCEGIGEILTPVPAPPACTVLIAKPASGISTAEAYATLDLKPIDRHPDTDALLHALRQGDLKGLCDAMDNVFEPVAFRRVPDIPALINTMQDYGALRAMMSGSGPSVFGIFRDESEAVKAYHVLKTKGRGMAVFVARCVKG